MRRRDFVLGVSLAACSTRKPRCKRCGMVLDPTSRWVTTLKLRDGSVETFDTPKCAFYLLRTGDREKDAALVVRGYYTQKELGEGDVVFARGSDVMGPMGEDLVPVEKELATKFKLEHRAKSLVVAADVTALVAEAP